MIKKYKLLLIGFIVLGTLLGSFHYHANANANEDCQICIVQNLLSSADIPEVFTLALVSLFFYKFILPKIIHISTACFCSYPSRAPPSFS
ncbi:MAG: hypothetical protein COA44_05625 [Arcobacter sp.]|nr:MAG: hypothetical protein COA44_05625 [Arcobacter sp.]